MACALNLVYIIIIMTINTETLHINVLNKKINTIKDMLELEIQLMRNELTQLTVNFDNYLHGVSSLSGVDRTDGLHKTNADLATFEDTTKRLGNLFNVLTRAFKAEKFALKKSHEEMKVNLIETVKHMNEIKGNLSSHESDITKLENKINNIIKNEDHKNMALIEVQGQLQTFNEKLESLSNYVRGNVEYVKNYLNESDANVETLKTKLRENSITLTTLETNLRSNWDLYERKLNTIQDILISKFPEDRNVMCRILGLSPPVRFDKSKYIHVNKSMNFQDATECCKQMSAQLPEVQNMEENQFYGAVFDIFSLVEQIWNEKDIGNGRIVEPQFLLEVKLGFKTGMLLSLTTREAMRTVWNYLHQAFGMTEVVARMCI